MDTQKTYTSFAGNRRIASGDLKTMLLETKKHIDRNESDTVLIFEDQTGTQIDFDFRGTPEEVIERLSSHPLFANTDTATKERTGPGRPKLGVVSREVSLLPRHWEWLERQPGGISVALRKLVEDARKSGRGKELARVAREAASKFMWVMAGNLPDFEEASRALFAKDQDKFETLVRTWPEDIRDHLLRLVNEAERLDHQAEAATEK